MVPLSLSTNVANTGREVALDVLYVKLFTSGETRSIQSTFATISPVAPFGPSNSHTQLPFSLNTTLAPVMFPPVKGEGAEGGRGFVGTCPLTITTPVLLKLTVANTSPLVKLDGEYSTFPVKSPLSIRVISMPVKSRFPRRSINSTDVEILSVKTFVNTFHGASPLREIGL
jgi:hypothetical protein